MARFRTRSVECDAYRWFKNGDHPDDRLPPYDKILLGERTEGAVVRYFRRPEPEFAGDRAHTCGRIWHDHGWIDSPQGGYTVCPGDYIVTGVRNEHYYPLHPADFALGFEPVDVSAGV